MNINHCVLDHRYGVADEKLNDVLYLVVVSYIRSSLVFYFVFFFTAATRVGRNSRLNINVSLFSSRTYVVLSATIAATACELTTSRTTIYTRCITPYSCKTLLVSVRGPTDYSPADSRSLLGNRQPLSLQPVTYRFRAKRCSSPRGPVGHYQILHCQALGFA